MIDNDQHLAANSHVALLVLGLVSEEPMYGYRIIKELGARSDGHFRLKEGSLYPVLHQLEKDGLLKTEWRQQRGKPNRRYYSITARGRKAFAAAKGEFDARVNAIRLVLECTA